jgi:hypothetical protein
MRTMTESRRIWRLVVSKRYDSSRSIASIAFNLVVARTNNYREAL